MRSDEYLELLNTYSDIILPSVYVNSQSYIEVLERIRYILEKLEEDNIVDYTQNFQDVIDSIAEKSAVFLSQISLANTATDSNVSEENAKITAEETSRKEADSNLETQIGEATKNLSNLAIKRSFVLIGDSESNISSIKSAMEAMGANVVSTLTANLPDASKALEDAEIDSKNEITDIVYIGSTTNTPTIATDITNLIAEREKTFPSAILEIMPYFNIYKTGTIYSAMKAGCQEGAIFLGGTASSFAYNSGEFSPWLASLEILNGEIRYDLEAYILSNIVANDNSFWGVKADITETGVFFQPCTIDSEYNETNSYADFSEWSQEKTISGLSVPIDLPEFKTYERAQTPSSYSTALSTINLADSKITITREGSFDFAIGIRGHGFLPREE